MMSYHGVICLSDIDKRYMRKGVDGKWYLNVNITEMNLPNNIGATHFIAVGAKQIEGANRFIGYCKPFNAVRP